MARLSILRKLVAFSGSAAFFAGTSFVGAASPCLAALANVNAMNPSVAARKKNENFGNPEINRFGIREKLARNFFAHVQVRRGACCHQTTRDRDKQRRQCCDEPVTDRKNGEC